jgi:stearoyl-CoA desaturase (delta-9 desaturase)
MFINIFWHRYFCHKSFKTSKFIELLSLLVGSLALFGNINTWVIEHKSHHNNKNKDIFNPNNTFISSLFWWIYETNIPSKKIDKYFANNSMFIFFDKHFKFISIISNSLIIYLLYSISQDIILSIFFGFSLRVQLFHFLYSLSHACGHSKFNWLENLHVLNLGESDHIEHHKNPSKNNFSGLSKLTFYLLLKSKLIKENK